MIYSIIHEMLSRIIYQINDDIHIRQWLGNMYSS